MNTKIGLRKHARSPGSIANAEHHDPSGSNKNANGVPATIKQVISASTTKTPLEAFAMLKVVNRNAAAQYIYVGQDSTVPATVDQSNSICLAPNESILLMAGASDDAADSMAVKTSHADVHVTILEV